MKMAIKKTHRNDCEQSRDGRINEEMKEILRVVKCTQRHRKINEATEAQVKEAAGTNSKKVDGDFPKNVRHKRDDNDDNKKRRLERKRRRKTQTLHRRWRCVTVSEKN